MKPPGILPADDILSSMSTLKGKNVAPGRGASERVAVDSTIVSPSLAVTEPPAWRASIPVSSAIARSPIGISKRIFSSSPLASWDLRELQGLAAQAELGDERPVGLDVLLLRVLDQPAPLADHLEHPPPRVVIVLVFAQVLGKVRYAPRENRDLDLGRPGVAVVGAMLPDYLLLVLNCGQLPLSPLYLSVSAFQPIQRYMLPHVSDRIFRYAPDLLDVARDLLYELLHPRKPLLPPYPPDEADVDYAPVQVAVEVKQVRLDAALSALECRGNPDVGGRSIQFFPHAREA